MDQKIALALVGVLSAGVGSGIAPLIGYLSTTSKLQTDLQTEEQRNYREDNSLLNKLLEEARNENRELKSQIDRLELRIATLEDTLRREVNFTDWLQQDIDSIPWPVKLTDVVIDSDRPLFPTTLINNAFSSAYGISKWRYQDKTASELWPIAQAGQFYAENLSVYNARGTTLREMCVEHRLTKKLECAPVLRRYTQKPDGSDGMRIDVMRGLRLADDCTCEAQN